MRNVDVLCDRCGSLIHGMRIEGAGTMGFYERNSIWAKYMDASESIVCDECMSVDPRYRGDYGRKIA